MNFPRYSSEIERAKRHLQDALDALEGEPTRMNTVMVAAALGAVTTAQSRLRDALVRMAEADPCESA